MKICLDARLSPEYLKQADEIKIQQRDLSIIPDMIEKYPNATIIAQIDTHEEPINWVDMKNWYILSRKKFVLCLGQYEDIQEAIRQQIPCYFGYPIKTFEELHSFKNMGVDYVRLGVPLIFSLDKVIAVLGEEGPKIRGIANVAHMDRLPHESGVVGGWIRPDDLELYEPYLYVVEFEGIKTNKEEALFRIYWKEKYWGGPLAMLIEGLEHEAANRLINSSLTRMRLTCGQKCQEGSKCRRCWRELDLCKESIYTPEVLASLEKLTNKQNN